jgi:hypothetical protein
MSATISLIKQSAPASLHSDTPGQQVFKQVFKVCETQGSKDLVEEMTVWHREQLEAT